MALDDRALDVHLRLLAEADGSALRRSHAVDRLVRALAELGLAERAHPRHADAGVRHPYQRGAAG